MISYCQCHHQGITVRPDDSFIILVWETYRQGPISPDFQRPFYVVYFWDLCLLGIGLPWCVGVTSSRKSSSNSLNFGDYLLILWFMQMLASAPWSSIFSCLFPKSRATLFQSPIMVSGVLWGMVFPGPCIPRWEFSSYKPPGISWLFSELSARILGLLFPHKTDQLSVCDEIFY